MRVYGTIFTTVIPVICIKKSLKYPKG